MRSSSRLCDRRQRLLDRGDDLVLLRACARPAAPRAADRTARGRAARSAPPAARCRASVVPHVVLRIGHADLAQEARDGADQRDVAPGEAGRQHQRVVAVVLGAAGHHHQEARFQPLLGIEQVDLAGAGALQHHVVQPDVGLGRRRRAGCGGSARPPRGSPCSRGPARVPTAGSGGRSSTPSARCRRRRSRCGGGSPRSAAAPPTGLRSP